MKRYQFLFEEYFSLSEVCRSGFVSVSLKKSKHGRPICIYLWQKNGSGVKIQCMMHDLDVRLEVGSLLFDKVDSNDGDLGIINLPKSFNDVLKLEKLLYVDEKSIVESGIVMTAITGEELLVISGAFPYTVELSITGSNQDFEPEYPVASYKRELMKS